jgi:hypothetical protein
MTKKRRFFNYVGSEFLGGLLAIIVSSIIFFVFSDFVFKPPDLNGRWVMTTNIERTKHEPFEGMIVMFEVVLQQDNDQIKGTAEKIAESSKSGTFAYQRANRVRADVYGSIDRNYLSKDKVNLHWIEHGTIRDSSSYFRITRFDNAYMYGTFDTTAGRSNGSSEWVRSVSQFESLTVENLQRVFGELGLD